MRVDGAGSLGAPGGPDGSTSRPQPPKPTGAAAPQPVPEVPDEKGAYRQYIQKAAAAEQADLKAIAEARRLLESGRLDTPEAAARAAERILSLGI